MRKVNYKEKGITLVALVVTIIILLILAGVTLNTALSQNGLFKRAKEATKKYKESEEQEKLALNDIAKELEKISIDYNDYVGCEVTEYTPNGKKCIIETNTSGYTTLQEFTAEDGMQWKIWDYDKNTKTIRLISSKPTSTQLFLTGTTGYNNGIWAINEVCRKCYGQYDEKDQMRRGISVANLRRSDIQNVSNYEYTLYKHKRVSSSDWNNGWKESLDGTIFFGSANTYNAKIKYSVMWDKDKEWNYEYKDGKEEGEDKEGLIWEKENDFKNDISTKEESSITVKESYYAHNYAKEEFKNERYYDMLFNKNESDEIASYWLAGRYIHLYEDCCDFGIQAINAWGDDCYVGGDSMFFTNRNRST